LIKILIIQIFLVVLVRNTARPFYDGRRDLIDFCEKLFNNQPVIFDGRRKP